MNCVNRNCMQRNALIALALCWGCVRANTEDPLSNPELVRDPINCRRSYRAGVAVHAIISHIYTHYQFLIKIQVLSFFLITNVINLGKCDSCCAISTYLKLTFNV